MGNAFHAVPEVVDRLTEYLKAKTAQGRLTVRKMQRETEEEKPTKRSKYPNELYQQVMEASGRLSIHALSAKFDVPTMTVYNWVMGITRQKQYKHFQAKGKHRK